MYSRCRNKLGPVFSVLFFLFWIPALLWALPGDLNESGRVDGFDLIKFSRAFDTQEGDLYWNPLADLNSDGTVNQDDLDIMKVYFGQMARSQGCWVADYGNDRAVLLGAQSGSLVKEVQNLNDPVAVDFDLSNSVTWILEKGNNAVQRISYNANGTAQIASIVGFNAPQDLTVNSVDGSCWVADTENDRVIRLANNTPHDYNLTNATGFHRTITGFSDPASVSVNSADGTCWVADTRNHQVVKLDANIQNGYDIGSDFGSHARTTGFSSPSAVAVNTLDGTCWAADPGKDRVVLLAKNGQVAIQTVPNFSNPVALSVNPLESEWFIRISC